MKKLFILLIVLLLSTMFVGCGWEKVTSGYVGVKVDLLGSAKGVQIEELGVGRYWVGINEELYRFPTFLQNYVWTEDRREGSMNDESFTFQTIEGTQVSCDVGISYSVDPTRVSDIFQKYRKGIGEITDVYLRNIVRNGFVTSGSTRKIESVYGKGKADLLAEVKTKVIEAVEPIGIKIEDIYLVGTFRLPPQIVKSINAKIEATQKAQKRENEIRTAEAEAQKKIAESKGIARSRELEAEGKAKAILIEAKAQAKANKILAASITSNLIKYKSIEQWDGKLSKFSGGGAVPFINVDNK